MTTTTIFIMLITATINWPFTTCQEFCQALYNVFCFNTCFRNRLRKSIGSYEVFQNMLMFSSIILGRIP